MLHTASLPALLVAFPLAAPASIQDTVKVFFGNLHSHTSFSDGSEKPEDAFKHARDTAKIDFLAITEHNHRWAENGIFGENDPRHTR